MLKKWANLRKTSKLTLEIEKETDNLIKKPEKNKMLKIWTKLGKTRNKSGNIRDKIIKIKQTKFLKKTAIQN